MSSSSHHQQKMSGRHYDTGRSGWTGGRISRTTKLPCIFGRSGFHGYRRYPGQKLRTVYHNDIKESYLQFLENRSN